MQDECNKNPENPRVIFDLAVAYDRLYDVDHSYYFYKLRSTMIGWPEETFAAHYRAAILTEKLAQDHKIAWSEVPEAYLQAYEFRPERAEPLIRLARFYLNQNKFALAYLYAQWATMIPYPENDNFFVENNLYNFDRWEILSGAAWYRGDFATGFAAAQNITRTQSECRCMLF